MAKLVQLFETNDKAIWTKMIPDLCDIALNGWWWSKKDAIGIIEKIGKEIPVPEAVDALTMAMMDDDGGVKSCAAKALGSIAATTEITKAKDSLINALGDHDSQLSEMVSWALKKIGTPMIKDLFLELERTSGFRETGIIRTLGQMGIMAIPEAIIALGHESEEIRNTAAAILEQTGDKRAIQFKKIIYDFAKDISLFPNVSYALELGLDRTLAIQREFLILIKDRYPKHRVEEWERKCARIYARVHGKICDRKKDAPLVDNELTRAAIERMEKRKLSNEPRIFRQIKTWRVVA
jgi:HEAT repeat protein